MLGTLLTIIIPGLGHLYYGYNKKAFLLIGLSILSAYFIPIAFLLYPYALYDIWKILKKSPKPKFKKIEAIQVVLIGLLVPIVLVLIWAISIPYIIRYYQNNISFPNKVLSEGREIVKGLDSYHQSFGRYPEKLALIIEGIPLRRSWENDSWERPYYYKVNESKKSYTLLSCGPDGLPDTDDDLVLKGESSGYR